jgi:ribonuclease HI
MFLKVKEKLNSLQTNLDKHVMFVWIPSHDGIKGNEKADVTAKAALDLPVSDLKIPHSDFKSLINPYITRK